MIEDSDPVFVKIDEYKEILDVVEVIDKKIGSVKQRLSEIEDLKSQEEEEIMNWERDIEEINHKLDSLKQELHQD